MTPTCTTHVYGTRTRCLICDHPAPAKPRPRRLRDEVDDELHERPAMWRARGEKRTRGIDDIAGWGETGDPWTGGRRMTAPPPHPARR